MDSSRSAGARILAPRISATVAKGSKRSYAAPVLQVYGSVRQLTLGSSPGGVDANLSKSHKGKSSDRSVKENILRIGTHPLGIGLYLFEYKPDYREEAGAGRHFGVMADEVESVLPQAVGRHARGHKTVDYAMLGVSAPGLVSG